MGRTFSALALLCLALCGSVGSAQGDLAPPYASADGSSPVSSEASDPSLILTGPIDPLGHSAYLARVTITSGQTSYYGNAGAVWWDFPPLGRAVPAGGAPEEFISCATNCGVHVDWFEVPTAPVTFSGVITQGPYGASDIGFIAPTEGNYHAAVTLTRGSVIFYGPGSCPNFSPIPATVSGTISLGHLNAGPNNFCILAPPDSGAAWSATIARDPVAVSLAAPPQSTARPGAPTEITFQVNESGTVSEVVRNAGTNQTVRTIGNAIGVLAGQNRATWNGLDDLGHPVPDGSYAISIASNDDPLIQTSALVALDATAPKVAVSGARVKSKYATVRIFASDLGGVQRGTVLAGGVQTSVTRFGPKGLAYHPLRGWRVGKNALRVSVIDVAGNTTVLQRTITLPKRKTR